MKFSIVQLFNVVDGRLSTKMEDVYDILNAASGESLLTHHLPVACDYFKLKRPQWWVSAENIINYQKAMVGNDFDTLINNLRYLGTSIEVDLWPDHLDFQTYMVENSLLRNMK